MVDAYSQPKAGDVKAPETDMSSNFDSRYRTALYIPNILDYSRAVILLITTTTFKTHPYTTFMLFLYICTADGMDGWLARTLNQTSILGATLDMIIDRCYDTLICMMLAVIYPEYAAPFMVLVFIDVFSHWMRHSYYSRRHDSHKSVEQGTTRLLGYYYRSRTLLFLLCLAYESFLISLYVYRAIDNSLMQNLAVFCIMISALPAGIKVYISVLQAIDAMLRLAGEV